MDVDERRHHKCFHIRYAYVLQIPVVGQRNPVLCRTYYRHFPQTKYAPPHFGDKICLWYILRHLGVNLFGGSLIFLWELRVAMALTQEGLQVVQASVAQLFVPKNVIHPWVIPMIHRLVRAGLCVNLERPCTGQHTGVSRVLNNSSTAVANNTLITSVLPFNIFAHRRAFWNTHHRVPSLCTEWYPPLLQGPYHKPC